MPVGPVRAFIACSLDGFIAGPDGDLDWLPSDATAGEDYGFGAHMAATGALLMGRATYDSIAERGWDWPYGDAPCWWRRRGRSSRSRPPRAPSAGRRRSRGGGAGGGR